MMEERLRAITSQYCVLCRRTSYGSDAERIEVAEHRLAHQREDKRRRSWRESKRRRAARPTSAIDGYLHNVGCRGGHYLQSGECTPIAAYRRRQQQS